MPDNTSIQLKKKSALADPRKNESQNVSITQEQVDRGIATYFDRHLAHIARPVSGDTDSRSLDPARALSERDRRLLDRWSRSRRPVPTWVAPVAVVSSILLLSFVGLLVLGLALLGVTASDLVLAAIVLGCFGLVTAGVVYLVFITFKE